MTANVMPHKSVDIVIPVYNEEVALPANIPILENYCTHNLNGYDWRIIIADNASTDRTPEIARSFSKRKNIFSHRIEQKGRGRALSETWSDSRAAIVSYMDVDLSSNLDFFPSLLVAIENGADIAIGSRLARGARVIGRTLAREVMSRGYNFLIRLFFDVSFHDAQCGFKAIKRSVFLNVLPKVENKNWFFDTELLVISEKMGYKIAEIPISWHDDPSSTVRVAGTASEDLRGLLRLWRTKTWVRGNTQIHKNTNSQT